jgi:hypothetical protein
MRSKLGSVLQGAVSCSETFHGMLSDEVILSKRITAENSTSAVLLETCER